MLIGDVARRAGLQTSAIRYYEAAGVLPKPQRLNGRRLYISPVKVGTTRWCAHCWKPKPMLIC